MPLCFCLFRRPILILLAAVPLFAGCGGSTSGKGALTLDSNATNGKAATLIAPPYAMPYVSKSELLCATADFATSIRLGPVDSASRITMRSLAFQVGDLRSALPGSAICAPGRGNIAGLVVHYGLDARMEFDAALEFVCLKPDTAPDSYIIGTATTYYRITDGHLVDQHKDVSDWDGKEGKRYADNVVLQLATDSAFTPFQQGRDVVCTVFRYDGELDLLIEQNGLQDSDSLDLIPTCVPFTRTEVDGQCVDHGLHQSICVAPFGVVLNDISYGPGMEYRHKAADLGSPCPPYQVVAIFPAHGLQRKPGC